MLTSAGKTSAIGFSHILKKFENKLRQRFLAVVSDGAAVGQHGVCILYPTFSKLSEKERQCEKGHIQLGFQLPHIKPVIRPHVSM